MFNAACLRQILNGFGNLLDLGVQAFLGDLEDRCHITGSGCLADGGVSIDFIDHTHMVADVFVISSIISLGNGNIADLNDGFMVGGREGLMGLICHVLQQNAETVIVVIGGGDHVNVGHAVVIFPGCGLGRLLAVVCSAGDHGDDHYQSEHKGENSLFHRGAYL